MDTLLATGSRIVNFKGVLKIMLMLTRYAGESIMLTLPSLETVEIKFSRYYDGVATIGINAPKNIHIIRSELYGKDPNKDASHMSMLSKKSK